MSDKRQNWGQISSSTPSLGTEGLPILTFLNLHKNEEMKTELNQSKKLKLLTLKIKNLNTWFSNIISNRNSSLESSFKKENAHPLEQLL